MKYRIKFFVGDRCYEAVSFLKEGEPSVGGDEMLRRAATENSGVIGVEDERYIAERLDNLPVELRRYWLVTNRRYPGDPRVIAGLDFDSGWWCQGWGRLDLPWVSCCLVVRRLP